MFGEGGLDIVGRKAEEVRFHVRYGDIMRAGAARLVRTHCAVMAEKITPSATRPTILLQQPFKVTTISCIAQMPWLDLKRSRCKFFEVVQQEGRALYPPSNNQ